MKLLFVTSATEHTTFRKTAKLLSKSGAHVKIIGFTRNNFPSGNEVIPTKVLGTVSHGSYLKRILIIIKFFREIREEARKTDVIYCFSLDVLLVTRIVLFFSENKIVIYQIQDIKRQLIGNSFKSKSYRFVEKTLLKSVSHIVVSSKDYYTSFLKKYYNYPESKASVIENKVEVLPKVYDFKSVDNQIRIGYFGVLRCRRSWDVLKTSALESKSNIFIYLRGKPSAVPNLKEQAEETSTISYDGPYKSPDDLDSIYSKVDIVWAAYPYNDNAEGNWRMARTIRFYEACAYRKPVLVQKGTPHASIVEDLEIGMVVDLSDLDTAVNQVLSITPKMIDSWKKNLLKVDESMFVHTDEYENLYELINKLLKNE